MAVTKQKKEKKIERPAVADDSDFVETSPAYSPRVMRSTPPYLLIILLMAISFFAGYMMFRINTLEKLLADSNQAPSQNQPQEQRPTEMKVRKPDDTDHWKGNKKADFVWIEYSDLECPFCKRNHPDLVKLMDEYGDKIAWVYRHYPLNFHPKAQKTAEATECAAELGGSDAFWQMTDLIFDRMPNLELTQLGDLAAEVGLNQAAFQTCLDSNKYADKVNEQLNEGTTAGVAATPTGVIYHMKSGKTHVVEGAYPYDSLKQELDSFMAANK